MRPGETRDPRRYDIANDGADALAARTYAADVYTIINGGFGGASARRARRPARPRGSTTRLEVIDLAVGAGVHRSFTVTVPANAAPGEYITSIVLENDQPIQGAGAVGLDQVVRQAVAVVITVPGDRAPGHRDRRARPTRSSPGGRSIAVAVENTGNVRLKPIVRLHAVRRLREPRSARRPCRWTRSTRRRATLVELPLAALLPPGRYTIRLTLADTVQGVTATEPAIVLIVDAPDANAGEGLAPGLTEVKQGIGDVAFALIPLVAALLAGIIIVAGIGRTVLLRRRPRA